MAIRKKAAKKKAAKKTEEAVDYPFPDSERHLTERDEFADGHRQALMEVREKLAACSHPAVDSRIRGVMEWINENLESMEFEPSDTNAKAEGDDA